MGLFSFFTKAARPSAAAGPLAATLGARLSDDPAERALQQFRFGMVAQAPPKWTETPRWDEHLERARAAIDERMALAPGGTAYLTLGIHDDPGAPECEATVEPFLLARHCVTNAEFQSFVDAGVYEDHRWWPEEIWPHLINFRDQTQKPGPRYWRDGRHDRRQASFPVVGVCWWEAAVYAAWAGYRLPTEAEWQVVASWSINAASVTARRYPWGDTLDLACCNIWASGHGKLLPVEACPNSATPNGVQQLIGNVWEWIDAEFECNDDEGRPIVGEAELKGIRGGAFDTYFPWQATATFRTGLSCLSRMHNVGFRCAAGVELCD